MDYNYDLWIIITPAITDSQTLLANCTDMNKYMDKWMDRYICWG